MFLEQNCAIVYKREGEFPVRGLKQWGGLNNLRHSTPTQLFYENYVQTQLIETHNFL